MSYCRFSSMNWMCDVYVYESCEGGWMTHVADNRRIFPPIPDINIMRMPTFGRTHDMETRRFSYPSRLHQLAGRACLSFWAFWHRQVHMRSLDLIPSRKIGLAHDGESFSDDGAEECADRLEWLRSEGYNVPQYAIDALRDDHQQNAAQGGGEK